MTETTATVKCGMHAAAVVVIGGHGDPVALVTAACVHEHITAGIVVCAECLARHAREVLCCRECEMGDHCEHHCCPLTLTVKIPEGSRP